MPNPIHITAIVFDDKKRGFSKTDLQYIINNIDDFFCADNLPKWLGISGHCKLTKKSMVKKLTELLDGPSLTIDVRY